MKLIFLWISLLASASVFAQQVQNMEEESSESSKSSSSRTTTDVTVNSKASVLSNQELTKLVRAQGASIKSLSSKVDFLEERIDNIDKFRR